MMPSAPTTSRLPTGVKNLDALLGGGLRTGTITVVAGPPGSGKTILAQQFAFNAARSGRRVLYFHTLSEPTAKTLLYLRDFRYFDPKLLDSHVKFVDLGIILRGDGLAQISAMIMEHVVETQPDIVVIDSFKIFDDLASSAEALRKFGYEIAVNLMAWECTSLLLGEYAQRDYETNPLFSIVDGLMTLGHGEISGEQQRHLQVVKMRGTSHVRESAPFQISYDGIEVFVPNLRTRSTANEGKMGPTTRHYTGIARLDDLLGDGIPEGSSLLVSGTAGTGKTALLLEALYRGATQYRESGILFTFDETEERLRATARGFGWELDRAIEEELIQIVAIPQADIRIEPHLAMIDELVFATGARRVAIDSISVFLHNLRDAQLVREKVYQLSSIVQRAGAIGFFSTDIPYGAAQLSRFGVEETAVDGVILLSAIERGLDRQRFLEVYKLRNTAHLHGRHSMTIGEGGISVYPRYGDEKDFVPPRPFDVTKRLSIGVKGLDDLLGGGVLERSVTLASGSTGIGKTTLGVQFALAGAARGEPTLFIAREEGPKQVLASASVLGLPLQNAVDNGLVEILYLSSQDIRAAQLLTILTEKIRARNVRRLVLDSATHLETDDLEAAELPHLLHALVVRFKALGVTSLLTLESKTMFATDTVTDQGLSPIADNLLLMRYASVGGGVHHSVGVIKTRGSKHTKGLFSFKIGEGGIVVGPRAGESDRAWGGGMP